MLHNVHILVVDPDPIERESLSHVLCEAGAIVHATCNRTEALFKYLTLFADDIIPRGIVTAWWLNTPTTAEFEFYKMIGRDEDNTAVNLIRRVRTVDPEVAIIVREDHLDSSVAETLDVHPFSRQAPLEQLVLTLESDPEIRQHQNRIAPTPHR